MGMAVFCEDLGVDPSDNGASGNEFAQIDRVLCRRSVLRALRDIWASRRGVPNAHRYLAIGFNTSNDSAWT
eukprot:4648389-Pyramimonas_sp.AAC.1